MAKYQCKPSRRLSAKDVDALGAVLDQITKKKDADVPRELVERSRATSSPTHHLFEWDDSKAAEAYRLRQAETHIASLEIVFEGDSSPVRAFPSVRIGGGNERTYMPISRVISEAELLKQLVDEAKLEAEQWARRHEALKHVAELHGIFAAIDGAMRPLPRMLA